MGRGLGTVAAQELVSPGSSSWSSIVPICGLGWEYRIPLAAKQPEGQGLPWQSQRSALLRPPTVNVTELLPCAEPQCTPPENEEHDVCVTGLLGVRSLSKQELLLIHPKSHHYY